MRPEEYGTTGGDGLLVPMAWMYAEYVADGLLATGDLMDPATLEYRAGREALALTLFLSDGAVAGALPAARVEELRLLTAYGAAWRRWVRAGLEDRERAAAADGRPAPGLDLARAAWRWLEETELLAADLGAIGAPRRERPGREEEDGEVRVWTPAWQLGLPLGHLAIHLY
ncbi:hypothetical protein [Streptomyces nitrosporeus]|uniref:DinB family protein n=1 Tax=Streptomyces nitrosporeus TaxID=28894 RepID=A0A5J6F3P3_9ACTN|nr:hypothetical protein [Streptomyces nitrosporeus]QEU70683.1 hypothetical protein CP967_00750 [Streptomyces nitrosporeus]GGZ06246.1 hypothetical protein GCM10010327_41060 [Streptomyces nitrosporeus]